MCTLALFALATCDGPRTRETPRATRPALPPEVAPFVPELERLAQQALSQCERLYVNEVGCVDYMPPAESEEDVREQMDVVRRVSDHPPGEGRGLITLEGRCTYPVAWMLERHPELSSMVEEYPIPMESIACAYRPWGTIREEECLFGRTWAEFPLDARTTVTVYVPSEPGCDGRWTQVWIEGARADGVTIRVVAKYEGRSTPATR